jgi:hypothetical protein
MLLLQEIRRELCVLYLQASLELSKSSAVIFI